MNSCKLEPAKRKLRSPSSFEISALRAFTSSDVKDSYLACWFRCLQLSDAYNQTSRTGIFTTQGAFKTYEMFGSVEHLTMKNWWLNAGFITFGPAMTSLRVTHVVRNKVSDALDITVNASMLTASKLTGEEFEFWIVQILKINSDGCLLSNAPLAWSIYKSRISCEAINAYLDVFCAYLLARRNSKKSKLWQIGEQMRLNPKAMPKSGDSIKELAEKRAAMGQTVSSLAKKGQLLVANAAKGKFPSLAS